MENNCSPLQLLVNEFSEASEERLQKLTEDICQYVEEAFKNGDNTLVEKTCSIALQQLDKTKGVIREKAILHKISGRAYHKSGNYRESLIHNHIAAELFENIGDIESAASMCGNSGVLLHLLGDRAGAYKKQQHVLTLAGKHNLRREKARALLNISSILRRRREYQEALEKLEETENIFKELSDQRGLAYTYSAIAIARKDIGDHNGCLAYQRKAFAIRQNLGVPVDAMLSHVGLAKALINTGKSLEAEQICREGLSAAEISEWPTTKALILVALCEALLEQNQAKKALLVIQETSDLFKTFQGYDESRTKLKIQESRALHALNRDTEAYQAIIDYVEMENGRLSEIRDEEISRIRVAAEVEASLKEREFIALKNTELQKTNNQLKDALAQVKILSGMLPICASCKRIRDGDGYWQQIESYISNHSDAEFSHGLCSDCLEKLYPEIAEDLQDKMLQK